MLNNDLFSLLVAAFTAGEKLGQENAKETYWTTYPKEEVESAAPKYAKAILSENAADLRSAEPPSTTD